MSSRMLFDEDDIRMFNAELAKEIGINEAIVLQQIHYWLTINQKANNNFKKGRYWIYNTYKDWQEDSFPFWSTRTISRIIKSLEEENYILTDNFNKTGFDKTKWYSINYGKLNKIAKNVYGDEQNDLSNMTDCHNGEGQNDTTNTKDFSKTSTKNNNMSSQKDDEIKEIWQQYKSIFADYYQPRKFSKKRKGKIKQRLKTYSVEELVNSMKAIVDNDYMLGKNDNNRFYAKPEYCFRNDEVIEEWLNKYEGAGVGDDQPEEEIDYYADLRN